ncbi:hypothetical protein V8C37DRAFT_162078 [Trichoderma ceciliae]
MMLQLALARWSSGALGRLCHLQARKSCPLKGVLVVLHDEMYHHTTFASTGTLPLVPFPKWRNERNSPSIALDTSTKVPAPESAALASLCGILRITHRRMRSLIRIRTGFLDVFGSLGCFW